MLFYLTKISPQVLYNYVITFLGGEAVTIYLDVLLGVNLIIDYYLLLLTFKFNSLKFKGWRLIFGASIGSLFSLYIFFLIDSILIDCVVKLICSMLMILISVGYINLKAFFRNVTLLFIVSFIYSGGMLALWSVLKWDTIIVNNSTVYLDISPIYLIGFSVIFYLTIVTINSVLQKKSIKADRCSVVLEFNKYSLELTGIFDTGNSVKDIFSDSAVIFISHKAAFDFLGNEPSKYIKNYRLLPCSTVTGSKLLEAVRIDRAEVKLENARITLYKPILAISEEAIDQEYSLILNPEILVNAEESYVKNKNSKYCVKHSN